MREGHRVAAGDGWQSVSDVRPHLFEAGGLHGDCDDALGGALVGVWPVGDDPAGFDEVAPVDGGRTPGDRNEPMSRVSTTGEANINGQVTAKDLPVADAAPVVAASGVPRLRRRPLLVVLAVALVAAGAALGVLLWSSATTSAEVVMVRSNVQRGQLITVTDLATVRVAVDPALRTVPAADLKRFVGKRAGSDLTAGTLLSPAQVADRVVPGTGDSLVGIAVGPGMLPSEPLRPGDAVRLVQTPGNGGQLSGTAAPVAIDATVVSVTVGESMTVVNVVVPSGRAAELAARAATGKVAVVLDSRVR